MENNNKPDTRDESFSINLWGLKINCNNPGYKSIIILVIILVFFFVVTKSINLQSLFASYPKTLTKGVSGLVKK
jgi:hypothetical protein